ncbi:MAG: ABC transporter permease [Oscillospiraceae bacterium]|nr:ABC transporter permease [Oscillospiraceae bacterium]
MRKITALFINEIIKITKKPTVFIMLIVLAVLTFVINGVFLYQEIEERAVVYAPAEEDYYKIHFEERIKNIEERIENYKKARDDYDQLDREERVADYNNLISLLEIIMDNYRMSIDNDINIYNLKNYLVDIYEKISTLSIDVNTIMSKSRITDEDRQELTRIRDLIDKYRVVIANRDFMQYLEISQFEAENDENLSDAQRQNALDRIALLRIADPTGTKGLEVKVNTEGMYYSPFQAAVNEADKDRLMLLENYELYGSDRIPLTPQKRTQLTDDLAIMEHRIINGYTIDPYLASYRETAMVSTLVLGLFFTMMLLIILAGGTISQEITSGSIKSLIIAPVKRSKIFAAKAISLAAVAIAVFIVVYLVSVVANGIFFGFDNYPYIYANNGVAGHIPYYIFRFAYLFVDLSTIFAYAILAYMLSVVTRNTATAVGVSIAVAFGGNLAFNAMSSNWTGEWVKFMPFHNLSLSDKIFIFDKAAQSNDIISMINSTGNVNVSALFSFCYLVVFMVCIGYIAMDSFCRRDI